MTSTVWMSEEIPVTGMVKTVTVDKDGKEVAKVELVDFGASGGADKPVGAPTPPPGEEKKEEPKKEMEGGEGGGR